MVGLRLEHSGPDNALLHFALILDLPKTVIGGLMGDIDSIIIKLGLVAELGDYLMLCINIRKTSFLHEVFFTLHSLTERLPFTVLGGCSR